MLKTNQINNLVRWLGKVVVTLVLAIHFISRSPGIALADITAQNGAVLFEQHCAGCHLNGGNIIRRNKTLKLAALKRRGIDSQAAIAEIARNGIGQMSGYAESLGTDGDELVAEWIWQQAQNAWIQG